MEMEKGKKMPEAGTGARREEEAAPTAYGADRRLVVLDKPLPLSSGAGYYCTPFAMVRFQDLPEELRRQIAAARPRDHSAAPVVLAAPLRGEGGRVDVVPEEGPGLRRQLPGLVSGPVDEPTVKFAGDGILQLVEEEGKVMACLNVNASRLQVLGVDDMDGSLSAEEKVFPHAWNWMGHSDGAKYKVVANDHSEPSNMAAERAAHAYILRAGENAAPIVALLLDDGHVAGPRALDSCSDGLPAFHAVPFVETLVGNRRATEQYVVVVPAAEALRGARPPTDAVQVWVDAAAGGKAGDPTAGGGKAAGADAGGDEHGGSLLPGVLGIVVASSAGTALAAGTVGTATAFGLFVALLGGLSLAMASVRGW